MIREPRFAWPKEVPSPPHWFQRSGEPVRLISADGSPMQGGDQSVSGRLGFIAVPRTPNQPLPREQGERVSFAVSGYVADIQYDMILSYPWMVCNGLWCASPYDCLFRETHFGDQFILELSAGHGPKPQGTASGSGFGSRLQRTNCIPSPFLHGNRSEEPREVAATTQSSWAPQ